MIVVGGGYIGAELAQMMRRMGGDVTVVCRSRLLPQVEPDVSAALSEAFRSEGIGLHCGITYDACRERSEEHTSELQSLMRSSYAVFCLKQQKRTTHYTNGQR